MSEDGLIYRSTCGTTWAGIGKTPNDVLAKWVAEIVMGWYLWPPDESYPVGFWQDNGILTGWCDREWPKGSTDPDDEEHYKGTAPQTFSGKGVWNPGEDMNAAWEVVDKLRERGFWTAIHNERPSQWGVYVRESRSWDRLVAEVEAPTASLAICQAALKALEDSSHA